MSTIPSSAELRELLAAATPRPWVQQRHTIHSELVGLLGGVSPGGLADAALIVALVNSAEHLLGALEENERLREALEEARAGLLPIARRAISDPPAVAAEQLCRIDSALARPHPDEEGDSDAG